MFASSAADDEKFHVPSSVECEKSVSRVLKQVIQRGRKE